MNKMEPTRLALEKQCQFVLLQPPKPCQFPSTVCQSEKEEEDDDDDDVEIQFF